MQYVITPTNSDLQHHGIIGMKWGRRNGPPYPLDSSVSTGSKLKSKGTSKKSASSKSSSRKKSKAQAEAAKKDVNKMSVQELRESNERLRLEQEHSRLTQSSSGSVAKSFGKNVLNKVLERYANEVATAFVGAVGVELGKKAIKYLASYRVMKNGALLLI